MNLITGATGIVGAHVALHLLQQNKPVVAIKRTNSDTSKTKQLFSYYSPDFENLFNRIKWVDGDILDIYSLLDVMEGIHTVYHCAGYVSFSSKQRKQLDVINSAGTANVVNACLEKNISALCYVSSIATLQNPDITKNINESVYWKSSPTVSDYAISKYNGEREVWRGMEEGLNVVIVNPGVIISAGFWSQSSGKMISTCFKGNSFYTKGSTAVVDAQDVATCMAQLVEKKQFGNRFIITENNYSFQTILSEIQKSLGKKEPSIKARKIVLLLASYMDYFKSLILGSEQVLTKDAVNAALEENTFDNSKIKQALNYKFIPFSQSVKHACQLFLADKK